MLSSKNSHLAHAHAPLSASQSAWTNYDLDKLEVMQRTRLAAQEGTRLHALAAELIALRQKLPDTGQTLNSHVNDAIGFLMIPEQVLFYSMNAFGTADAITDRNNFLRIHDLKTGINEANVRQLETYAAFYCLQEKKNPMLLEGMEFRIYQNDDIKVFEGDPHTVTQIMETTKTFSKRLDEMRMEVE